MHSIDSTIAKGAVDDLAAGPAPDAEFLGAGRELRAKDVERCGALLEDVKARIKKKDTKELKEELETVLKVQACLEDGKDVRCRLVMLAQPPCGCAGRGRATHDCAQWGADAVGTLCAAFSHGVEQAGACLGLYLHGAFDPLRPAPTFLSCTW